MSSSGLLGKKFVGRIVAGQDQNQRGMYYVHIPELQPHMAETVGVLCTNAIHPTRVTNSSRGCFGAYTPLHPNTVVQVECLTDDPSSLQITKIVSDDQNKSDMSAGKILGVEPSGKIVQIKVDGYSEKVTDPSKLDKSTINTQLNANNSLIETIKDKLGDIYNNFKSIITNAVPKLNSRNIAQSQLSVDAFDTAAAKKEFKEIQAKANTSVTFNQNDFKTKDGVVSYEKASGSSSNTVSAADLLAKQSNPQEYTQILSIMRDERAKSITGNSSASYSSLTDKQKAIINTEVGVIDETKYVNSKKSSWEKENSGKLFNRFSNNSGDDRPAYGYGEGTKKQELNERDEQYVLAITPNKSGIYINEETKNDANSLYIVYRGKETAVRFDDGGIHLSTDHNFFQKITVNNDIVIDGTSSITVNGGNYDLYVNGTTNLYATGDINQYSEKDINIRAVGNVNLESGKNITALANNELMTYSSNMTTLMANSDFNVISKSKYQQKSDGPTRITANGRMSIKSSDIVALDGSATYLQSDQADSAEIQELNNEDIPVANPAKRDVCKI